MTDSTTQMSPSDFAAARAEVRRQVGVVIVGQTDLVDTVLMGALCEGHVLLEGVPGLGKTKLLATLGSALDVEFGRVQFTPDLMPADILGTNVLQGDRFVFHEGPIFANLVLADEINRATPKTQSALLEAMQERSVTLGGERHDLPRPFLVMATQNPIEQEGTYPLPEAQLDRFLFKAIVPFPPAEDLVEILRRTTASTEPQAQPVVDGEKLRAMSGLVRSLPAGTHLLRYAATLVEATHPASPIAPDSVRTYVRNGASPRGAQALIMGGKARALMDGRPNVAAEDIWALAPMALRHRLVLGYDALADGVSADDIVKAVVEAHPEPVEGVRPVEDAAEPAALRGLMLLEPRFRARLERLSLGVQGRVTAQWAGRHSSTRLGESLDFADYRPYQPGDDYRRIDHNLRARLGVLMIRQFEAEQELPIEVVLDLSGSMGLHGKEISARRLAAMVTYMGLAAGDRVRLWSIPGDGDRAEVMGPNGRHLSAWPRMEAWLEGRPVGGAGNMRHVGRRLSGSGGSVVLVSDLLMEDWRDVLDGLVSTAGGLVLHLLAPEEMDPSIAGDFDLVDVESGMKLPVSTNEDVLRRYRSAVEKFATDAARRSRRAGLDYLLVESGHGAEERALEGLARREVVR